MRWRYLDAGLLLTREDYWCLENGAWKMQPWLKDLFQPQKLGATTPAKVRVAQHSIL
jgi:hypothetical protein